MVRLFSACNQLDGAGVEEWTIGEAVKTGLVNNETLGYYLVRCQQFLHKVSPSLPQMMIGWREEGGWVQVGVDGMRLRFRQHMSNEMAHYAKDCWDAEVLTSYGWIECVGNADRAAFDLTQHTAATGVRLAAERKLDAPKTVHVTELVPNKAAVGKAFKKDARLVYAFCSALDPAGVAAFKEKLDKGGAVEVEEEGVKLKLTKDLVEVKSYDKTVHVEEVTLFSVPSGTWTLGVMLGRSLCDRAVVRDRARDVRRPRAQLPGPRQRRAAERRAFFPFGVLKRN